MKDDKYKLLYTFRFESLSKGYTTDDIENTDQGLCDAMILISIIRPQDGGYSQLVLSIDGQTKAELTSIDLFKAWLMLGIQLSENSELDGWQKQMVDGHKTTMRGVMELIRAQEELKKYNIN